MPAAPFEVQAERARRQVIDSVAAAGLDDILLLGH